MGQKQKDARAARRTRCINAGEARLILLRSGAANKEEEAEMRGAVLRGDCPLCGESGFKNIALHCQQMHSVSTRELRDLLGLTFTESICAPELSETFRALSAGRNPRAKKSPSGHKVYSKKGEAIRNGNLAPPLTWVTKDVLRENGRKAGAARKGQAPWNKTTEHGTRAMFRQGCRCDLCDSANKAYWRQFNQRRAKPSNDKLRGAL